MTETAPAGAVRSRRRLPRLETLVIGALVLLGYAIGLRRIVDNSTFTHLRTGIDMIHSWSVPRQDPYSFTAYHHPWVVQSWFASAIYGVANRLFGLRGVVMFQGLVTAAVTLVVALLARTGSVMRTAATATLAMWVGAVIWSPRPLMIGLLCFGLVVMAVERRWHPVWLLPITWVWVNSHGSFPLGLGWIVLRAVGENFDTRTKPAAARYVGWFVGGLVVACINPLGPRLLAFPLVAESKKGAFRGIIEWQSPNFQSSYGFVLLVALTFSYLILLRARVPWRDALPAVVFVASGLFVVRNIGPAAIALAPALGRALRVEQVEGGPVTEASANDPDAPSDDTKASPSAPAAVSDRMVRTAVALLIVLGLLFTSNGLTEHSLDLSTYPADAVSWMASQGLLDPARHRVAGQAITGNYLELVDGTRVRVFIDDRVDMFPVQVTEDYYKLHTGSPKTPTILDRYGVDTVVWDASLPLVGILRTAGGWRTVYTTPAPKPGNLTWVVMVRDPAVRPGGEAVS